MKNKISLIIVFILFLGFFSFSSSNLVSAADCEYSFTVNYGSYKNIDFNLISCVSANNIKYQGIQTAAKCGAVEAINDRKLRYTPSSCCGTDSFIFTAKDGGTTKTVQVNITITCNDPPVPDCIYYYDYSINTVDSFSVNTAAQSCYPTSNYKASLILVEPIDGTATIISSGNHIQYYLTNSDYCGDNITFTFLADKSGQGGDIPDPITIQVVLRIICPNNPPVAINDSNSTVDNTTCKDINVTANDYDSDGDPLTIISVTTPNFGSATIANATGGIIQFCPEGSCGTATFEYNVSDGNGGSDVATVTVTVPCPQNNPPVAINDSNSTVDNTTCKDINVTANDYDSDGDPLTIISVTTPNFGSATIANATGGIIQFCPEGSCGTATFEYNVSDGNGGSDVATVTVTVPCPQNNPPVAINDSNSTVDNTTCKDINVTANDYDSDGDPLTIISVTTPNFGSATIANATGGIIQFCPEGSCGTATFEYNVSDGNGGSDVATVTVTVPCPQNNPPVAINDSNSTVDNTTCKDINVTANDYDSDGDPLTIISVTTPNFGSATIANATGGIIQFCPEGSCGTATFEYNVSDGNGGSDVATVTVTVPCPQNNPPVAINDSNSTVDNTTCKDINVTANDYDSDGDPLTIISVTTPNFGSATIANATGGIIQFCPEGSCGTATFEYNVSDGNGGSDVATVTVTVPCPQNNPPVALDDYNSTSLNTCVIMNVLINDTDANYDILNITNVSNPSNGTIQVIDYENGIIRYCPNENFCGIDSFTYFAIEAHTKEQYSDVATVYVEVICEEPIQKVPAILLFPLVDIQSLTLTQGPVPIDGSIGAILDTGTSIIVDGKVISLLEISSGSKTLIAQVDNDGFLTQNEVSIRFEGLPQGVSVNLMPEYQKIKAHNTGTYIVTLTVSENAPKGSYFVTVRAFTRRGSLDSEIINLVIS